MNYPVELLSHQKRAREFVDRGCVVEMEFSQSSYQIKILDPEGGQGYWTFLQFGLQEKLVDFLCGCQDFDAEQGCVHVAAACIKIFGGTHEPLHVRFNASFWNQLCSVFFEASLLYEHPFEGGEDTYTTLDALAPYKMMWVPKELETDLVLSRLIFPEHEEAEENSIKFSNLSEEELHLWRQGRPSLSLRYELSLWSELAKWWMQQVEHGWTYHIEFIEQGVPCAFWLRSAQCDVYVEFQPKDWERFVPALHTVHANLALYESIEDAPKRLTFDAHALCLEMESKGESHEDKSQGISIGDWIYVPQEGFFPKQPHTLHLPRRILSDDMESFLDHHTHFVKQQLCDLTLHDYVSTLRYQIQFDATWNLRIEAYLFSPHDLRDGHFFGHWAFLPNDGFYRVEGKQFPHVLHHVPAQDISAFVRTHRAWLNGQAGFETHVAHIESSLTYQLSPRHVLSIHHALEDSLDHEGHHNFGDWIYVEGEGFFETKSPSITSGVYAGLRVFPEKIPPFIEENMAELKHLPGFFASARAIERFGLCVSYDSARGLCTVSPEYEWQEGVRREEVLFFGSWGFYQGFFRVPVDPKIPPQYVQERLVPRFEMESFFANDLEMLRPFALEIAQELQKPLSLRPVLVSLKLFEEDLLEMELVYESEWGRVDAVSLLGKMKARDHFYPCAAGLVRLKGRRFEWLRQVSRASIDIERGKFVITPWELMKLHLLEQPRPPQEGHGLDLFCEMIREPDTQTPCLEGLEATLRPYQTVGLEWMWHLKEHHCSGILADDMGLGKTLQAISLLVALKNQSKKRLSILVICPTSVLFHWQEKCAQFYPSLQLYVHFGHKRDLKNRGADDEVLLTSYGTFRSDQKQLLQSRYDVAIFDEIQVAKNHTSLLYQALRQIKAKLRIGLTGTPIENSTRELKALFDLVLPGYMPREEVFRDVYLRPIEKEGDEVKKQQLSLLVSPFILRRKKEEVLLDLPEKIEEISHCLMTPDQYQLYQDLLHHERHALSQGLETGVKTAIHVFALLSKLKQVCNHPACYFKKPQEFRHYSSGKFALFQELLDEALGSEQKVVVFSQYLHMLDIFELYLHEKGIGFASVRGGTQDRRKEIHRFQQDPNTRVFLGSLQATGLGIELTAASVVIHYDRWWNAARENQATDRVHRMGQQQGVQVFKLVTVDTLEERIDALIQKKQRLLEDVVGEDDASLLKNLSKEELFSLLQDAKDPS